MMDKNIKSFIRNNFYERAQSNQTLLCVKTFFCL
jgi:hypothetical protein